MNTTKQKGGSRFSTSLIIGLLLVPLSAVAAVALVNPDASAEPEEVAATAVAETTTTMTAVAETTVPEIASDEDLELACGEQGMALTTKEADATISPLEQAALDSLRAICLAEGMELPGPPAPEAVIETVTVVAAPASSGAATSDTFDDAAAEFEAEYAATVAHRRGYPNSAQEISRSLEALGGDYPELGRAIWERIRHGELPPIIREVPEDDIQPEAEDGDR